MHAVAPQRDAVGPVALGRAPRSALQDRHPLRRLRPGDPANRSGRKLARLHACTDTRTDACRSLGAPILRVSEHASMHAKKHASLRLGQHLCTHARVQPGEHVCTQRSMRTCAQRERAAKQVCQLKRKQACIVACKQASMRAKKQANKQPKKLACQLESWALCLPA